MIDLHQNWEKLTAYNKTRVEIYPQNQVILDCIMPSTLRHKRLSIILIWVIVSKFLIKSSGLLRNFFFLFLIQLGKTDMVLGKKVAIFDWEWG